MRARFLPGKKKWWDPAREEPPADDGTWETCIVTVREWGTIQRVFQWLDSGQHPFRSVTIDSLTEAQKRCLDAIVGTNAPDQQNFGSLLRQVEAMVRTFRDLTEHPVKKVDVVAFICFTDNRSGVYRPLLQGALALSLPYLVDAAGYLYTEPNGDGQLHRKLLVSPTPGFVAKDNTNALARKFGATIEAPNLEKFWQAINEREDG